MSADTYEFESQSNSLEIYEWDDVWWDHPTDTSLPRITYIGDSISRGTRKAMAPLITGSLLLDNFATSKALDNPYFASALSLFFSQQKRCDALLFNNGLHGWHLADDEYASYYEKMICFLRQSLPDTPLIAVLSTYLSNAEQNSRVRARNAIARGIAERYGLPILDFYTVAKQNASTMISDGVHFEKEGYCALANEMLKFLAPILEK